MPSAAIFPPRLLCGLRLEREEGGFLGAVTINYVVTAGVWVVLLVVWLVVGLPDLHVAALTIASLAVAGLFPLLFWPFSKTIWASVDYLIYRTSPDYGSREYSVRDCEGHLWSFGTYDPYAES